MIAPANYQPEQPVCAIPFPAFRAVSSINKTLETGTVASLLDAAKPFCKRIFPFEFEASEASMDSEAGRMGRSKRTDV